MTHHFNAPAIAFIIVCGFLADALGTRSPNVIYILADDVGYGDLSCYGQKKFKTPHLDRMAEEGMRFTEHYSGSCVCAPSRYTLMTGKHIARARTEGQGQQLQPEEFTLADAFKQNGYSTGMIGKWGLGGHTGRPDLQGFDFWFGFLDQRRAHFHYPEWVWKNGEKIPYPDNPKTHEHHTQNLFTEEAIGFIREHRQTPFFLYLPYTLVHAELIVPQEYEEPFIGQLDDKPVEPAPYGILRSGYNRPRHRHAAFAGTMTCLDDHIGKLFEELKALQLDQSTIVLFTSDNGPHSEGGADPRYFNSSGGLKRGKGWLYEGGIRVPMIVRWPGKIAPGTTSKHPSWFPDVFNTLGDLCNMELTPGDRDGISFAPTLLNKNQQPNPYMYWSYNRHRAIRQGKWKLYRFYEKFNDINRYKEELYNLDDDSGEMNDLAEKFPERVKQLATKLNGYERWK